MPEFTSRVLSNECNISRNQRTCLITALQPHRVLFAEEASINSKKSVCTSVNFCSTDRTYCIKDPRILGSIARRNVQAQPVPFKAIFKWKLYLDRKSGGEEVLKYSSSISIHCTFLLFTSLSASSVLHTLQCCFMEEAFLTTV